MGVAPVGEATTVASAAMPVEDAAAALAARRWSCPGTIAGGRINVDVAAMAIPSGEIAD